MTARAYKIYNCVISGVALNSKGSNETLFRGKYARFDILDVSSQRARGGGRRRAARRGSARISRAGQTDKKLLSFIYHSKGLIAGGRGVAGGGAPTRGLQQTRARTCLPQAAALGRPRAAARAHSDCIATEPDKF